MKLKSTRHSSRSFHQRLHTVLFSSREGFIVVSQLFFGIVYCVFSLLVLIYFTQLVMNQGLFLIDTTISQFIVSLRSPDLTTVMLLLTKLGGRVPFIIVSLLCIVLLIKKHRKEAMLFSLALTIGTLLSLFFKYSIQRPRPDVLALDLETTSSFPSSHSMNAFIFCALLSYFSFHFFRRKKLTLLITLLSVIYVLLVGFSRIYLGVHYFTDVLAGYIAGFWWFVTVLMIDKAFIFYRLYKRTE